jgi:GGDEF domain-containing protein
MVDDTARRPPARARPVADLPVSFLGRSEEIARRWAVALILARPIEALGQIALADIAARAPSLCGQLLRALHSEQELERLLGREEPRDRGGAAYPALAAALAGAADARGIIQAVEALRGAAWELLLDELGVAGEGAESARARRLTDCCDRLAYVCAALSAEAVAVEPEHPPEAAAEHERASVASPGASRAGIVIVDERGYSEPAAPDGPATVRQGGPDEGEHGGERVAEIEIRDARGEAGPSAWIGSIGRQLERFEQDGLPFAVALMEVDRAGAPVTEGEGELLERVLAAELRAAGGGTVTRERGGRFWLLVPRADRIGAHALAARLEGAVAAAGAGGGAPLTVASGTAVCPEDGRQAAALAAHADVGLYAARWEARSAAAGGAASE